MKRLNLFWRIVLMLTMILIVTVLLFDRSVTMLSAAYEEDIQSSNRAHLQLLTAELNSYVTQMSKNLIALLDNSVVREYQQNYLQSDFLDIDAVETKLQIRKLLDTQCAISSLKITLTLYSPSLQTTISSGCDSHYDAEYLKTIRRSTWRYNQIDDGEPFFALCITSPFQVNVVPDETNLLLELRCNASEFAACLTRAGKDTGNDYFMLSPSGQVIRASNANPTLIEEIALAANQPSGPKESSQWTYRKNQNQYLVNTADLDQLGWKLITYSETDALFKPMRDSQILFSVAILALLIFSTLFALYVYLEVQKPVRFLRKSFTQICARDYRTRIELRTSRDFQPLIDGFNTMAGELSEQIESTAREQRRADEADLRQLQSRIRRGRSRIGC